MQCPFCHAADTKVVDSRHLGEKNTIKRRRQCQECEKRFNTYESFLVEMPMIAKSDGRREEYNPDKLKSGIDKACQKRPIAVSQKDRLIENVERTLAELSDKEVTSAELGKLVMENLRVLDPVAYIRFASVYWNFQDIDEFVNGLKLNEEKPQPLKQ